MDDRCQPGDRPISSPLIAIPLAAIDSVQGNKLLVPTLPTEALAYAALFIDWSESPEENVWRGPGTEPITSPISPCGGSRHGSVSTYFSALPVGS